MKQFLHVGCGALNKSVLKGFNSGEWQEIRFDINQAVNPDILGTLTDMSLVKDGSVDAIYSAHNIEHLFPHEVPIALKEFHRVLKQEGMVVITCPDLKSVCEAVANDQLLEPLYESTAGPISAIDILYGHRQAIARGNLFMAHKCGFTYKALLGSLYEAGFEAMYGGSRPAEFDLWIAAFKSTKTEDQMREIASEFLPSD